VSFTGRDGSTPFSRIFDVNEAPAYDRIGRGYARHRRGDPRIAALIDAALGEACSVVNVGAGSGSYEPATREVTAVEPSAEMIAQRPEGAAPVVQASAESLPFETGSFDAAMAVLTAHHWHDLGAGLAEMQRVARSRIVMVTFEPEALQSLWIATDYFPEILGLHRPSGASSGNLVEMLPAATSSPLLVPSDCEDLFFAALWARPELFFDDDVVRPMWVWQSISTEARRVGREKLRADLESGAWEQRHGRLRETDELDVGLRLVVSDLGAG
jgi:SAM-dependent methyltransferase